MRSVFIVEARQLSGEHRPISWRSQSRRGKASLSSSPPKLRTLAAAREQSSRLEHERFQAWRVQSTPPGAEKPGQRTVRPIDRHRTKPGPTGRPALQHAVVAHNDSVSIEFPRRSAAAHGPDCITAIDRFITPTLREQRHQVLQCDERKSGQISADKECAAAAQKGFEGVLHARAKAPLPLIDEIGVEALCELPKIR